jgi:hypothetical protein
MDAHQIIAHRNAVLVRISRQPSNEQLMEEQQAATVVSLLRDEVLAMQESPLLGRASACATLQP